MEWPLTGRDEELEAAVQTVESGKGVALLGGAGVGKSRLLHEVIDRLAGPGVSTYRAISTDSTRSVPFAPFAPFLPDGQTSDRTDLFRHVLGSMREMADTRRLVLAFDDAQHLDEGSLGMVTTIIATGAATVCLTARTGQPMRADLVDLWTDGVIERMDLAPLDETRTRRLIEATLGEVDGSLVQTLWKMADGNPLVLHELVEGAVGGAIQRDESGVWRLQGALAQSPRLVDLVRARGEQIPPDLRHALELVSVGTPLPIEILEVAAGKDEVAALEEVRLITCERIGGQVMVRPAHPLHGEILKENLGETRRRRANGELVAAAAGRTELIDELILAVWQRDSGSIESEAIAARGGIIALSRHDAALAEELVRPIADRSPAGGLVLGRALTFQQRYQEAEEVFAALVSTDPEVAGELASARAYNLAFGLGQVTAAVEVLELAAALSPPHLRARLDAERGMISAIRGDFTDAESAGRAVAANAAAPPATRASGYVSLNLALAMTAQCNELDEIVEDSFAAARAAKTTAPLAEDQIAVMRISAMCVAGRIADASELAAEYLERSAGTVLESTWLDASMFWLDLAGRLRTGLRNGMAARRLMSEADPFRLEPQARGFCALERGQLGDPDADRDLEGVEFALPDPRLSVWIDRGRVWARAARGEIAEAVALAAETGLAALQHQHISWGAPALHDAVRLGAAQLVAEDLAAVRSDRGAHLIDTMADHAAAAAAADGPALMGVASSFAGMGACLLAAEAAAQAATALTGGQAGVAAFLSMAWERRCEDPDTVALSKRPDIVSPREMEVALDASAGSSSREISERRFISARTVDNHLASVYRKLEVGGREELAAVLEPALTDGGSQAP